MKKLVIGAMAAMVGALALLSTASASDSASVRVAHGIPGQDLGADPALPVDVLVNDSICLLEGFTFGEFAGPVELAPGTYNIKISLADPGNACSNSPVIEADVPFAAGEDATVIAHLSEAGDPTASKFTDDLSRTGFVKSRLIVHHTAAAPTVDVEVRRPSFFGRTLNIDDFSHGDQASAEAWPGRWKVSISPAGASDPVFGPVPLNVRPFRTYLVYAVGSVDTGSFTLLVEPVRTGSGFSWR
jgi:hypothetical protein